jgi:hypothetical protein
MSGVQYQPGNDNLKKRQREEEYMHIKEAFVSQYAASLAMMEHTVIACNKDLWNDERDKNRLWQVAYHALFFTDLYLSEDEKHFVPWAKHQDDHQVLGDKVPWPPHHAPKIGEPYTKDEILEYCTSLQTTLAERVEPLDFEGPSGFFWLPFSKLEVQMYNIRHLQHHTGQLIDRVRERQGVAIQWVAKGPA